MNRVQYNNVIANTLRHHVDGLIDEPLDAVRLIFKNMGVAFPNGNHKSVLDILSTDDYMGWGLCSQSEAVEAANQGIPSIAISDENIVILAACEDDNSKEIIEKSALVYADYDTSFSPTTQFLVYNRASTTSTNNWPKVSDPIIFPREDWGAAAPRTDEMELRGVAHRIIFHHTTDKFNSKDKEKTIEEIKNIQEKQMNSDDPYADIAYHFIIDPQGRIWEGRSLKYKGSHTKNYNDDIGVVLLGDFEPRVLNTWIPNNLNDAQKSAMKRISQWLCYKYNLPMNYSIDQNRKPIATHRIMDSDTVCPGANAAPWIEGELTEQIQASFL